MKVVLHDK
uniref:Uncharacterized protein n=1 Tax=Arundo donax TaxID=35708 RepID=A0A0A9HTP2_ARUDO